MPEPRGGGATPAARVVPGALDGRLDLDDLDAALDLDVIGTGSDAPLLSERVADLLGSWGVLTFVRRHRTSLAAATLGTALLVGSTTWWWVSRPVPLHSTPLLLVKTSGPDRTQVTLDPADATTTGITLSVAVASVERAGVRVELLSIDGPGLRPPATTQGTAVDTSQTDSVADVSARLDCSTPAALQAVLAARPEDYGVVVRRTAPEGETREDRIRLVGAQHLAAVVHDTCLQLLAARELSLVAVSVTPAAGQAAGYLDVTVRSTGGSAWSSMSPSAEARPWLLALGPAVDVAPSTTRTLRTWLQLQDCADPSGVLADGVLLRTRLVPAGTPASGEGSDAEVRLPLSDAQRQVVDTAFGRVCAHQPPVASVTQSVVLTGSSTSSAGVLGLTMSVRAAGGDRLHVVDEGTGAGGRLQAEAPTIRLDHGHGTLQVTWDLPSCSALLAAGIPTMSVELLSTAEPDRAPMPYVMSLVGEQLQIGLRSLCGEPAAALVQ